MRSSFVFDCARASQAGSGLNRLCSEGFVRIRRVELQGAQRQSRIGDLGAAQRRPRTAAADSLEMPVGQLMLLNVAGDRVGVQVGFVIFIVQTYQGIRHAAGCNALQQTVAPTVEKFRHMFCFDARRGVRPLQSPRGAPCRSPSQ